VGSPEREINHEESAMNGVLFFAYGATAFAPPSNQKETQLEEWVVASRARYHSPKGEYEYAVLRRLKVERDYVLGLPKNADLSVGDKVVFTMTSTGRKKVEVTFQPLEGSVSIRPFEHKLEGVGLTTLVARKSLLYELHEREWRLVGYDGNQLL
jgi:hypothetical protein